MKISLVLTLNENAHAMIRMEVEECEDFIPQTSKTPILIKATATQITPSAQHQLHHNQSGLFMLFSCNKIRER